MVLEPPMHIRERRATILADYTLFRPAVDLEGVAAHPMTLALSSRLVYSPHCYGPSVFDQPYFSDPSFPSNMPAM